MAFCHSLGGFLYGPWVSEKGSKRQRVSVDGVSLSRLLLSTGKGLRDVDVC
jgi:hypothetical protein